jgi:cation:H+ antiporter
MLVVATAILVGFIILIWSADLFVTGAAAIARNLGMSPIIVGMTIVSLGTSAPEILVSLTAAISGTGDLAVGNAIGSNIANIGLVLGVTVLVAPLVLPQCAIQTEVVILLVATVAVGLLLGNGTLSRLDGWVMMAAMAAILTYLLRTQSKDRELIAEALEEPQPDITSARAWLLFIIGLLLLVASSRLLVWGAVMAADAMGVSALVIGLTVIAIGTSLPELAATMASAMRGHADIALGNVVGSNLFNLLAVMAIPGIVEPQLLEAGVVSRDYATMLLLTVLLSLAIYLGRWRSAASADHFYLGRSAGVLLVTIYALYYYRLYTSI